jgi:phage terminase small subunit
MNMNAISFNEHLDEEDKLLEDLNFQQETFARAYVVNGRNASGAAREAGYASPAETGYRLTKVPHVKAYIDYLIARERELRDAQLRARHLTPDRIIEELSVMAGFDLGDLIVQGPDGPRLDATRLKSEHTRALASIETEKGNGRTKVKIKAHDKLRALDMLAKVFGMIKDNSQVNVQVNVGFAERMAARRTRALEDR